MQIRNLLMFTGQAEEATGFYVALFPQSRIVSVARHGAGEAGTAQNRFGVSRQLILR
jgi:predicted 3-demethylubiquinone-9 3-methyltransferase (glyoxalase superfamily)